VSFDLSVDPQPEGMSEMVDAEGNALSQVWFVGVASMLALRTTFAVDTLQTNPFDYIVLDPDSLRVPMTYGEADRRALLHCPDARELPRHQRGVDDGNADHREGADVCRERLPATGARHPGPRDGPAAAPRLDGHEGERGSLVVGAEADPPVSSDGAAPGRPGPGPEEYGAVIVERAPDGC